jgi:hypothetical protein
VAQIAAGSEKSSFFFGYGWGIILSILCVFMQKNRSGGSAAK